LAEIVESDDENSLPVDTLSCTLKIIAPFVFMSTLKPLLEADSYLEITVCLPFELVLFKVSKLNQPEILKLLVPN